MQLFINIKKYINLKVLSLATNQLLIFLPPLILLPFLTRTLGLQVYGELAFLLAIAALVSIFIEWGFNWSATNLISANKDSLENLEEIFNKTFQCQLSLICAGFIFYSFNYIFFNFNLDSKFFYIFIILLPQVTLPYWLYYGLEDYKSFALVTFLSKFLSIFLIFYFIDGPEDLGNVILLNNLPLAIIGLIFTIFFIHSKEINLKKIQLNELFFHLRSNFDTFSSKISVASYTMLVPVFLGAFHGTSLVAIYSIADKCKGLIQSAMTPFIEFMFTRFSNSKIQKNNSPFKFFIFGFIICFIICLFVYIFSSEIIHLIAGSEFIKSSDILRIFSFLPLIIYTSSYFGLIKLFAYGKKLAFNRNLRLVSLAVIFLCIPTIWYGKILGAAFLVIAAEIGVLILMIRSNIKNG